MEHSFGQLQRINVERRAGMIVCIHATLYHMAHQLIYRLLEGRGTFNPDSVQDQITFNFSKILGNLPTHDTLTKITQSHDYQVYLKGILIYFLISVARWAVRFKISCRDTFEV